MKRILIAILVSLLMPVSVALAAGKSAPSGRSNIGHLYLYEKDPTTWEIVEGGAWGKMQYNLSGPTFGFVFNGHSLDPSQEYTLMYYPDPWPGNGLICLGSAAADEDGNVHISGSVEIKSLPMLGDENKDGAKIWLVLSSDVDCTGDRMINWHPTEYLFEHNLITFNAE